MVNNLADGILSTSSRAWILTPAANTRSVLRAVRVYETFRPATLVGVSNIILQTWARACTVGNSANCVRTTGRWYTRVWSFQGSEFRYESNHGLVKHLCSQILVNSKFVELANKLKKINNNLRCLKTHWVNGSPVKSVMHTQTGVWLTTRQIALVPQEPGHGSRHFWLIQARPSEHSLLAIHCGLHSGGWPMKSGRQ